VVVCTLDDLLLDDAVRVDGLIDVGTDTYDQTTIHADGQAANVEVWAQELGAAARLTCQRLNDLAGTVLSTQGLNLVAKKNRAEFPASPAEVVDTTVADDTLAAGSLVGGVEFGLKATACCIRQPGAIP